MKCFYHDDADGKCAGFWVHLSVELKDIEKFSSDFLSINYGQEFPFDIIGKDEQVWIVDFSIEVEDMEKLLKITKDVTWIDHHASSIDKYKDFNQEISGVRYDGIAGCELTYAYIHMMTHDRGDSGVITHEFLPSMLDDCPMLTRYIGDRDVWKFAFGDKSKAIHEAFLMAGQPEPSSDWWTDLLTDDDKIEKEIYIGKSLMKHSDMLNSASIKSWGYEAIFEGYTIYVCNSTTRSSTLFGDKINDYDFVSAYTHDGDQFSVSLYSVNMDVRFLAEKYGGGGHERACGFVAKDIPFVKVIKK